MKLYVYFRFRFWNVICSKLNVSADFIQLGSTSERTVLMVWITVKGLTSLNVVLILKLLLVQQTKKFPTSYETHVHRSAVLNHILGQLNSVNILTPYTFRFPKWYFSLQFSE